jgi:DNA polymerase III subunit epsilon
VDRSHLKESVGLFDGPVAFVDVETTGGGASRHRIIEIGVVAATGGELEYEWSTFVNPGVPIPFAIEQFTGITEEMVRHAPFFEDLADELAGRFAGRLFVAHNARFDYGFFRREFNRAGRRFSSRVACTVRLSRRLYAEESRHSLDALIERLGLACERRHRALPDAQVLWQFWQTLARTRQRDEVEEALQAITHLKSLPAHLPADLADALPEAPGVYRFYGENDALLYVGKARDIRQRVLAHWQNVSRDERSQRLAELVRRVEWDETAGELGALLLEARLIRESKPLHNRALRRARQGWTIVVADDGAAPRIEPIESVQLSFEPSDCFSLFPSERAAHAALTSLAREHRLCAKMLGLEDTEGSCFAFQLGRCEGACVGRESLARHTVRVKLALAPLRLKPWPFAGPIGIRERSANGREQLHVLDAWRHLATLDSQDQSQLDFEGMSRGDRLAFDLDVYRIVQRYLSKARRPAVIQPVGFGLRASGFGPEQDG